MRTSSPVVRHHVTRASRGTRCLAAAWLALLTLALAACGGGGGDTPSGPSQPTPVLTTLTVSLAVTTLEVGQATSATVAGRDQNGASIATGAVTWSSSATSVATVNESGAITTLAPGQTLITASAGGRQGSASLTVTAGPPASVSAAGATTVNATAGSAVAERPRVLVRDARGFAVPNVAVIFAVTSGGGTLAAASAVTDAEGAATVAGWTVGTRIGVNTMTATVGTLPPVVFTATPSAGPPANVVAASAIAQTATVARAVADAPAVRVTDAFDNPAAGASVTFAVVSGGGTVTGGSAVADSNGVARAASWSLGTAAGANGVTATVGTLAPVAFSATGTPDVPAQVRVIRGAGQSATVATLVVVSPAVRVADRFDNATSGVGVTFTVASGGGAVTSGSSLTDSAGVAAVGSWQLGTVAGRNVLTASVAGAPSAAVEATGTAGPPVLYGFLVGQGQIEVVNTELPTVPRVRVVDAYANPVAGVPVTFSVTQGGGVIGTPNTVTNGDGEVTPGFWRLGGAQGFNRLAASAPGFQPLSLRARAVPPSAFDIDVRYIGSPPSAEVQAVVRAAVARLRKVFIVSGTPVALNWAANDCYVGQPAMSEVVSGVVIWVDIRSIDGPGGNLGSASWCQRRVPSYITAMGFTRLDLDDLADGLRDGTAYSTIVHELLHVLGFGSYWQHRGLLSGQFTSDPWFNGSFARTAFNLLGGASYGGNKVPVENVGGSGTALSHWRTSLFGGEMMTGFACRGVVPLSFITTESFWDMGILVSSYGDDDYTVPFRSCPAGRRAGYEVPMVTMQRYIDEVTGAVLSAEEAMATHPEPRRLAPRTREAVPEEVLERRRGR